MSEDHAENDEDEAYAPHPEEDFENGFAEFPELAGLRLDFLDHGGAVFVTHNDRIGWLYYGVEPHDAYAVERGRRGQILARAFFGFVHDTSNCVTRYAFKALSFSLS